MTSITQLARRTKDPTCGPPTLKRCMSPGDRSYPVSDLVILRQRMSILITGDTALADCCNTAQLPSKSVCAAPDRSVANRVFRRRQHSGAPRTASRVILVNGSSSAWCILSSDLYGRYKTERRQHYSCMTTVLTHPELTARHPQGDHPTRQKPDLPSLATPPQRNRARLPGRC